MACTRGASSDLAAQLGAMKRMRTSTISKRKQRGRPTVLNAVLAKRICASLEAGATLESAAVREGISERTLFNWLDRGEAGEVAFSSFFFEVQRARASYESRLRKVILNAAEGVLPRHADWKAAAWALERRFPRAYAPPKQREIAAPQASSPDDSGALQDLLLRARAAGDQERVERLRWALAEVRAHNQRLLRLVELLKAEAEGLPPPQETVT